MSGTGAERLVVKRDQAIALQADFLACSRMSLRRSGIMQELALVPKQNLGLGNPQSDGLCARRARTREENQGGPERRTDSVFSQLREEMVFLDGSTEG